MASAPTGHGLRLIAILALAACDASSSSTSTDTLTSAPTPPTSSRALQADAPKIWKVDGETTSALIHDPKLAALVDALAAEPIYQSAFIGAAARKSEVYAKAERVRDAARNEDKVALLRHEAIVVRAYAAEAVAYSVPEGIAALEPMLDSKIIVSTQLGCAGGATPLAQLVTEALCASPLEEAAKLLAKRADGDHPESAQALACVTDARPALAAPVIAKKLALTAPAARAPLYELALLAPSADACALARDEHAVGAPLAAATRALGRCEDAASYASLTERARSGDFGLREAASVGLAVHPSTDDAARRALFGGSNAHAIAGALRRVLRVSPSPSQLAIARVFAEVNPFEARPTLTNIPISPAATHLMRALAKSIPPGEAAARRGIRTAALQYLANAKDAASKAEFRRTLDASKNAEELAPAIDGVVAIGDVESKARLLAIAKARYGDAITSRATAAAAKLSQ